MHECVKSLQKAKRAKAPALKPSAVFRRSTPHMINEARPRPYVDGHNDRQVLLRIAFALRRLECLTTEGVLHDIAGDVEDVASRINQTHDAG